MCFSNRQRLSQSHPTAGYPAGRRDRGWDRETRPPRIHSMQRSECARSVPGVSGGSNPPGRRHPPSIRPAPEWAHSLHRGTSTRGRDDPAAAGDSNRPQTAEPPERHISADLHWFPRFFGPIPHRSAIRQRYRRNYTRPVPAERCRSMAPRCPKRPARGRRFPLPGRLPASEESDLPIAAVQIGQRPAVVLLVISLLHFPGEPVKLRIGKGMHT